MLGGANQRKGCTAIHGITARYNVFWAAKRQSAILLTKFNIMESNVNKNRSFVEHKSWAAWIMDILSQTGIKPFQNGFIDGACDETYEN